MWIHIVHAYRVLFGFCYVTPSDSPYFSPTQFSKIQEKIKSSDVNTKLLIIGDMNSLFCEAVRDLPTSSEIPDAALYTYPHIPDQVAVPNDNTTILAAACAEKLVIVNNLKTPVRHFPSQLTYKKASV